MIVGELLVQVFQLAAGFSRVVAADVFKGNQDACKRSQVTRMVGRQSKLLVLVGLLSGL